MVPVDAARLSAHAAACASCGRYDRIVRKGTALIRGLPDVQPSENFDLRLQHRILHIQDEDALARPRATGATALGIAAAIALLAWSPLLVANDGGRTAVSAPETVRAAEHAAIDSPLFDVSPWAPVAMPTARTQPTTTLLALFPGPYSPLIVTPPAHRPVRSVSSGYTPVD